MIDAPEGLPPGCEVLLLEDDAALRKRLGAHMRSLGAVVTEAGTLAEARRLLGDTEAQVSYPLTAKDLATPSASETHRPRPPRASPWAWPTNSMPPSTATAEASCA